MTRIILSGCNGKMGKVIAACVSDREDAAIVAGIDLNTESDGSYPVYATPQECFTQGPKADVVIDFSHPSVTCSLMDAAVAANLPVVMATTGLGEEELDAVHRAAKQIPVFSSANMSLGVNLLVELAKKAAVALGIEYNIEIVERHHNQKVDAPSGTAMMIADELKSVVDFDAEYVYDRHHVRKKRDPREIGLHAIRGGTIVGDHEVIFAGRDEILTLSHSARSKDIFATGAINAAVFLSKQGKGLYDMGDLVK